MSGERRRGPSDVCIVGCGAVTPLGHSAVVTAASVRASLSRFKESAFVDRIGQPMKLSLVEVHDASLRGVERLAALAMPAAREALAPLERTRPIEESVVDISLCVGTAASRPGFSHTSGPALLAQLTSSLAPRGGYLKGSVVAVGHSSALIAMEQAAGWIRDGTESFVLVGGVDSYYDPDTLEWLDDGKRLHSDKNKDGFVPGEGAGFCLLTSVERAVREGLTPLAIVASQSSAHEPHPLTSEGVCIGEGLTTALRSTLDGAGERKADWTLCDINGESYRGMEWAYAYLRTGRRHADPLEIWHPADCYGDIGAASGAVLTTLAVAAWRRRYARGDRALVWTSSDGPERSAALLENP